MPTYDTTGPISALVRIYVGDIRIAPIAGSHVSVEVRPANPRRNADVRAAQETTVDFQAGQLAVRGPRDWRRFTSITAGAVDVDIQLPESSNLELATDMGQIVVNGVVGDTSASTSMGAIRLDRTSRLHATTSHGDVVVEAVAGDAEISVSSGDVRIGTVSGGLRVKNSSGDTTLRSAGGETRLTASNGSIRVGDAARGLTAKTSHGSVRVGRLAGGVANLQTSVGNVEVGVADGVRAWLDVSTSVGRVRNSLTDAAAPAAAEPASPTAQITARTSAGDIVVTRA